MNFTGFFLVLFAVKMLLLHRNNVPMPKGRSKELISRRDEKLLRRYYYWTEVQRLRFDDALKVLSRDEFFISEERIMTIIRKNCRKLTDIVVQPVPKVRKPRINPAQLSLFTGE